jgi:predicted unusual protein kinase regulating ubiquinone biosynthesis (AarF/ABC1/UbiB family)
MHKDYDNSAPPPPGDSVAGDGIPVLHDVVKPYVNADIPTLDASLAVTLPTLPRPKNGITTERIAEIADTLQLTLNRELDYAIDGAVYERLQTAMEEVAASVKKQIHEQLEQKLPELIEQTLGKDN